MIVALIDNGSLEPAAHHNLRAVAAALSVRTGVSIEAVSWKHSDRIPVRALMGAATCAPGSSVAAPIKVRTETTEGAWTLAPWIRAQLARGEREFLFVPFFISAQGAIGSALRSDLEKLSAQLGGFSFAFTEGLSASGALAGIVAARVRETIAAQQLSRPAVLLVDHGGPSAASAALRDETAAQVRALLGAGVGSLAATSMEGTHGPLFADTLATPPFARGDLVVAPLFLSPGRHAGPNGDLARIAASASTPARCHFTELVGTHPAAVDTLAAAVRRALAVPPLRLSA